MYTHKLHKTNISRHKTNSSFRALSCMYVHALGRFFTPHFPKFQPKLLQTRPTVAKTVKRKIPKNSDNLFVRHIKLKKYSKGDKRGRRNDVLATCDLITIRFWKVIQLYIYLSLFNDTTPWEMTN